MFPTAEWRECTECDRTSLYNRYKSWVADTDITWSTVAYTSFLRIWHHHFPMLRCGEPYQGCCDSCALFKSKLQRWQISKEERKVSRTSTKPISQ